MLKSANSNREIKINPDLRRFINEILAKNPEFDQDKVFQKIKEARLLRLPEGVIKLGVELFFKDIKREPTSTAEIPQQVKENGKEVVEIDLQSKPKKKVKKNEFIIDFEDNQNYKFENLGGISQVLEKIQSQLFSLIINESYFKKLSKVSPNRGFLLSGSPGSGKTILANCILSFLSKLQPKKLTAYSVSSFEFMGGDAEQKLKKLFQTAEETMPSIIFIDNLEELCNKENNKRMQSLPSLTLCNYITKSKDKDIYFLGATSAPEKLDSLTKPGMFYKQIKISNPDQFQRKEILEKLLLSYVHNVADNMKELTLLTAGYVAVDMTSLLKEAAVRCVDRISKLGEQADVIITVDDVRAAVKEVQPVLKKDGFAKIPSVKLEDVGALENIKEELTQEIIMPLKEQEKFKNMNFEISGGGILLYGPPGCGKTMIAKAIANEANANFITVKGPELLTKYVGESQQAVRKVFERARMSSPCIIFFDEFDALAPKRQDQGNQVTERVVNTLLNELNGVDDRKMVFVIAATNRPDIIDEAVLRSGRIEKHLYVPLPNERERLQILKKITRKVNHEENLELENIATHTDNFSGADLFFLVKKSIMSAISKNNQQITAQDMKSALQTYKQDKYNKNNRLKLSQFEQKEEKESEYLEEKLEAEQNLPQMTSMSGKKSKSMMQIQLNDDKPKKEKKQTAGKIFEEFMEFMLSKGKRN